jgi:hypothetical protein
LSSTATTTAAFSSAWTTTTGQHLNNNLSSFQTAKGTTTTTRHRFLSSSSNAPPPPPNAHFQPKPPDELNLEMARGIQQANLMILRHGIGKQRLELLAQTSFADMELTAKWQQMMEIYLTCQLHIVAALGYPTNEQGIMQYTRHLAQFVAGCSPDVQEEFRKVGRDTWREMLTVAFDLEEILLDKKALDTELSIVEARNIMHQVSSQLIQPSVLELVAQQCSQLPHGTYY